MEGGSGDAAAVWGPSVPGKLGGDGVRGVQAKTLYVPARTSPAQARRDRSCPLAARKQIPRLCFAHPAADLDEVMPSHFPLQVGSLWVQPCLEQIDRNWGHQGPSPSPALPLARWACGMEPAGTAQLLRLSAKLFLLVAWASPKSARSRCGVPPFAKTPQGKSHRFRPPSSRTQQG